MISVEQARLGIIGLGYVGLPLAVEFGRKYDTVGFDINKARVAELEGGEDATLECSSEELAAAKQLTYTSDVGDLKDCNFYVVTVPTPIGEIVDERAIVSRRPDGARPNKPRTASVGFEWVF